MPGRLPSEDSVSARLRAASWTDTYYNCFVLGYYPPDITGYDRTYYVDQIL